MKKLVSAALAAALTLSAPAVASAAQPEASPAPVVPAALNLSSELGGSFGVISEEVWQAVVVALDLLPEGLRTIVSENSNVLDYYRDLDTQNWKDYGRMKSQLTPQ